VNECLHQQIEEAGTVEEEEECRRNSQTEDGLEGEDARRLQEVCHGPLPFGVNVANHVPQQLREVGHAHARD
jgi:hypothetical protein